MKLNDELEIARVAVKIQKGTGTRNPAILAGLVQREHLAFRVRLKPHRQRLGLGVPGQRRAGRIHFPNAESVRRRAGRDRPASGTEPDQEAAGMHVDTMRSPLVTSKRWHVGREFHTLAPY